MQSTTKTARFADDPAKAAAWAAIKADRAVAMNLPLWTPFGLLDCDAAGREGIATAVSLGEGLERAGKPVAVPFTCADNTIATLDLSGLRIVQQLLARRITGDHILSQELYAQLVDCASEEAASVAWCSGVIDGRRQRIPL